MTVHTRDELIGLQPRNATLVGIDSDGCVFDSMEIKQKQCFHPEIIRHWGLERIEKELRAAAEFVNLYSKWRGSNRFPALLRTFDLLGGWPEVAAAGVALPPTGALRRYVESGLALSNNTLRDEARRTGDPELADLLAWSEAVNDTIERTVQRIPPFAWARRALEAMGGRSDLIVCSQTPEEALVREWEQNGIRSFVSFIAGQELGTKGEHLAMASRGKYGPGRVLMIGDALGDLKAARSAGALFFPVNPGGEEASWERLCAEAYDRFVAGTFAGAYEQELITAFEALLPEAPPWSA